MSKQAKKTAPAIIIKPSVFDRFEEQTMWHILILLIVPFFIYIKAVGFDFIRLTDNDIFVNKDAYLFRPVVNLSFMLDGIIGSGRSWIYHLSNIIFHLLTAISLYSLLRFLEIKKLAAFILSFFFALHPLLAGDVSWVPARADILVSLWIILSLYNFGKYIQTGKILFFILHVLLFALAVFTKETAALFPLLFLFYSIFILKEKISSKKNVLFSIAWVTIILLFFYLRSKVIGTGLRNNAFGINAFIDNLPTIPILLAKIFVPACLSPMPLFDNSFETAGVVLLLFFAIIVIKKLIKKEWLPLMGYIWFLLLLSACFLFQFKDSKFLQAYTEQEAYLPLTGFIILLAYLLNEKLQQPARQVYTWLSFIIIIVFMILASLYSDSYKDSEAYLESAADQNNPGAYTKRGEDLISTSRDYSDALAAFNKAVDLSGGLYAPAYYDLGKITSDHFKNHEDAESYFTQAITLDSTFIDAYIDRAAEKLMLQNINGAFADLNEAKSIDSTNARIYYTFGKVYVGLRDFPHAIIQYSKAIDFDRSHTEIYYSDRGLAYYEVKDYPAAIKDETKAISLGRLFTAYYNKAMIYYTINKMDIALKLFDTTLALQNNLSDGYFYRGSTKHQLNDMKGACNDWQEAVNLGFTQAEDSLKRYCK
jgi:tetratricopeptide (TPR) repeat protein